MSALVPVADPAREVHALGGAVEEAVARVVRSGRYVLGPEHDAFEAEFAAYLGAAHAAGVANGTDALELALRAVGCGPGDEVLTVANAGGYAATAAVAVGARPVYVEVDATDLLADLDDLTARIGPRTAAVVVTHLYGRVHPRVAEIVAACARAGVPVVEDCAQSTGAVLAGRHAGTFGTAAAHSFYPTKNLGALGDGGMVSTDDAEVDRTVRALRHYGWDAPQHGVVPNGRNSRLDEVQAAVLRVKLPHLDRAVERRRAVAERYRTVAPSFRWIGAGGPSDASHLCVLAVPEREAFRRAAEEAGVGTAVHFGVPDHLQPSLPPGDRPLPVTERACAEVVSLPCHPHLTEAEIRRVLDLLERSA